MLRAAVVLLILACLFSTALAQDDKALKEELERLRGTWKPISCENEGKEWDVKEGDHQLKHWSLKFDGDKMVHLRNGNVHVEGKVEIASPTKASKRAYWKYTNVEVTDSVRYFFVGSDTLVTCWTGKEGGIAEWPNGFKTGEPGAGAYLVVWKRDK